MTVKELIDILRSKPQDLPVAYALHSDYKLLEADEIMVEPLCLPRNDEWIHRPRPDKPTQLYLTLPGN